jgi:transposase
MQGYAEEALAAHREIGRAKRALKKLAQQDATLARQAAAIGAATACVLRVAVGCVRDYSSGGAYRKALGLNLKERSSGKYQGKLKLTKRGPSLARRWLFFAAMRLLQRPPVRGWYEAKKARDGDQGLKAVIGVMRKLVLALYAVGARGEAFEPSRLFPGRLRGKKNSGLKEFFPGGSAPSPPGFIALVSSPEMTRKTERGDACRPSSGL